MQANQNKLLLIQALSVMALLAVVPFAAQFTPATTFPDHRQPHVIVVVVGLLLPIFSILPVYLSLSNKRPWRRTATLFAACLACFAIGWRCIPYWVNGVYARDLGLLSPLDMDPKRLMPMVWIGEIWRLGVLLLVLVTGVSVPVLIGIAIQSAVRRKGLDSALTLVFAVLAGGFLFWYQKDYIGWLMD